MAERKSVRNTNPFGRQRGPTLDELSSALLGDGDTLSSSPNSAIVEHENGALTFGRFTLSSVGLEIPNDVTQDEWEALGRVVRRLESSLSWIIGDWADFAYTVWGIEYSVMSDQWQYEVETLYTYAGVCRALPHPMRRPELSFGHHRLVTKLSTQEQHDWLAAAVEHKWTVQQMKAAMHQAVGGQKAYLLDEPYRRSLRRAANVPPNWRTMPTARLRRLYADVSEARETLAELERQMKNHLDVPISTE